MYNLNASSETGAIQSNVTEAFVHPDWDPWSIQFDADLAILLLSQNITFTRYIRPACIPISDATERNGTIEFIDMKGVIVGWGETENRTYENLPRQAFVKILNDSFCYVNDTAMTAFSSDRTFCGGFGDGDPGFGDSGTGLYVQLDNSWVQYGIVSTMLWNSAGVIKSMAVYTNVQPHRAWIAEKVESTGGEVGEAMIPIALNCTFANDKQLMYGCFSRHFDIKRENVFVSFINGSHPPGLSHENVDLLQFTNGTMIGLPNGIGKLFRNLKTLWVSEVKVIKRSNFRDMKNLNSLHIFGIGVETLEEDTFRDLLNLEILHMENGKLTELSEIIFQDNVNLKVIHLLSNRGLVSLPERVFETNALLTDLFLGNNSLTTLPGRIFASNIDLDRVGLGSNMFDYLPENLFKNNLRLRVLDLTRNRIQALDADFFVVNAKLSALKLSFNRLTTIPRDLFKNNSLLKLIHMTGNPLHEIDEKIFENNPQLWEIRVAENFISTIEDNVFKKNANLQKVDLSSNVLEHLSSALFEKNDRLTKINVNNNSIRTLDEQIFSNKALLQVVLMSRNRIEFLPINLFTNNSDLTIVDFSFNKLKAIHSDTFSRNSRLKAIYLCYNQIESLPRDLFSTNSLLETVHFDNNLLRTIEFDFTKLRHAQRIELNSNICIDDDLHIRYRHSKSFAILVEFQKLVERRCSSNIRTEPLNVTTPFVEEHTIEKNWEEEENIFERFRSFERKAKQKR